MIKKSVKIFILIDALGWNFIKDKIFLEDIIITRRKLKTVLGYSSAAIPTILSGKYPQEHGHWSYFYYNPQKSPFKWARYISILPAKFRERILPRARIQSISKRMSGYKGTFSISAIPVEYLYLFDICEKNNIWEVKGLNNATKSLFDYLNENEIMYNFYGWPIDDDTNLRYLYKELYDVGVHFIYLWEMDHCMHIYGVNSQETECKLRYYEEYIRKLYQKAKLIYSNVYLYIFSDHGMKDIDARINLIKEISKLGFSIPRDYVPFYDSTIARFWFFNDLARNTVSNLLDSLDYGYILNDEEMSNLGIKFENKKFGDVVFLMKPGIVIEPSFMGLKAPKAMHGFHPDDISSDAIFLSNTTLTRYPEHIKDILDICLEISLGAK